MTVAYPLWQHVTLDRARGDIIGQLYGQLRAAVLAGLLPAGTRLPSSREIASALGIARGTVVDAFARLLADELLVARQGAGTFVASTAAPSGYAPAPALREAPSGHGTPLSPGIPALGLFPRELWARLYTRNLRELGPRILDYGDPQGYAPLRVAIAGYLRALRGIAADPARIVVTGGSVAGAALVAAAGGRPGGAAWVEDPGHPPTRDALVAAGLAVIGCPVDAGGMDFAAAARAVPRPCVALVTPAHQYPLGAALLPERKLALLRLAEARDFLVIEDDYDHEFRYDGEPSPPLCAMAPERVAYLGTFSKLLVPGLRLGFVLAPAAVTARIVQLKAAGDRHPPSCIQAAAASFIEEGHLARHIGRMRPVYAERRAALLAALGDGLAPWQGPAAPAYGLQMTLRLPAGIADAEVEARARQAGLGARSLGRYRLSPFEAAPAGGLVAGFANNDPVVLRQSIGTLRRLVRDAATPRRTDAVAQSVFLRSLG